MRIRPKKRHGRVLLHSLLIGSLLLAGLALPAWAAGKKNAAWLSLLPPPRPASPHR